MHGDLNHCQNGGMINIHLQVFIQLVGCVDMYMLRKMGWNGTRKDKKLYGNY